MNKRKSRGGGGGGGGGGGITRSFRARSVATEGVYNNAHFMHAATSIVGNVVRVQTVSGSVWEGVFRTFSSQFDIVLEVAAKVVNPNSNNSSLASDSVVDKLIFKSCDIISMVAKDVDLDYATRDTFHTDTAISNKFNGQQKVLEERELEPWDPATGINGDDTSLELEPGGANGWDANDMFRKNEQVYGVTSTYDQTLSAYTVQLQHMDSPDYREQEAKAEQIANEIEQQPNYRARLELENGDEEERFAAVIRPSSIPLPDTNYSKSSLESSGKYVPPAKRKSQTTGKLMRSTPPPQPQLPQTTSSAQTTPSPKAVNVPPVQYPSPPVVSPIVNHVPPPPHVYNVPPPPINQHQHQPPPHQLQPHQHPPPHQQQSSPLQHQQQAPPPQIPPQRQINNSNTKSPPQLNGEINVVKPSNNVPVQRNTRNFVPSENIGRPPRHRDEIKQELNKFSQEFKLAQPASNETPITSPVVETQPPPPPPQSIIQQVITTPPPLPQQPITPPQPENVDKVTTTLKKSTLNPNAKEFVFSPMAKPFVPRSPSTPSVSRPHTPQTPNHNPYIPATITGPPPGQPPTMPVVMGYMLPTQAQYQPQPHPQSNRIRKVPMGQMRADMASQMQVAAATGQPLLAPAPIQQFVYPPGINPQAYQQMHALRMYESPQIQYIPQNHSNAPSPAQQHAPYTQNQGPQPPPQQYQAAQPPQGHPQFPIMCPIIPTQPHMMPGMHYIQQPPTQQGPIQVLLQQPPHQQHGGP